MIRVYESKWMLLAIVALGIGLRLQNYLVDFDMFGDEISVASSLLKRTYGQLWKPLDYYQNAPIGFVMVAKFFTQVLPEDKPEYGLRLYSLLTAIASVPLFWILARKTLSRRAVPLAVFLFAVSKYLVGYSSEVKQYSGDVMVAVGLLLASVWLAQTKLSIPRLLLYSLIGAVGIWFSQPAVFILAGIGISWSIKALGRRRVREFLCLLPVFVFWGANFAVYYVTVAAKYVYNDDYLNYFARSFMPWPPVSYSDLCWFPNLLLTIVEAPGGFRPTVAMVICLLLVVGYAVLYKSRRSIFFFCLSFVPLVLLASGLKLFPIQHRIVLFAIPVLLLGVAQGTAVTARVFKPAPWAAIAVVLIVVLPPFLDIRKFPVKPFSNAGIRDSAKYLLENKKAGDTVFLLGGFARAFKYYTDKYEERETAGLQLIEIRKPKGFQDLENGLSQLKGLGRVWLFMDTRFHINAANNKWFITYYLNKIGRCVDVFEGEYVSLYLYDFDDSRTAEHPSQPDRHANLHE